MVVMRVRGWGEAASERKNKHIEENIHSGKLKRQLPEQAVEGLKCHGGGRGVGVKKKMTKVQRHP